MDSRRQRGFTLIELLVALIVVVVALAAVQRTTLQAVANTEAMQLASFAHWVAKNQLNAMHVQDSWPSPGRRNDTVLFAEQEWHWTQEVRNTDDPRLRVVEIAVRLDADPRDSVRARLTGYLMQPANQGNAGGGMSAR